MRLFAQSDTLSVSEKAMLDSLIANDPFLNFMKDSLKKNTIFFSVGAGNGGFSLHNNAANSTGYTKQLILLPGVNYFTKSGFNFGVTGFITNDSARKPEIYQAGLTAGYSQYGKKINTGISYTRFMRTGAAYNSKSLYQNELFAFFSKAKGYIRPGVSIGFTNGNYKEVSLVSYTRTIHLNFPLPDGRDTTITLRGRDSTNNKTSYFSIAANAKHEFNFKKIFNKKDELGISPSLMINFGSDHLTQTHTNAIYDRNRRLNQVKRIEATNKFQVQSLAVSFDVMYGFGKFFFQPNLYLDYYLPQTTTQRWSTIFSVTAGVAF